MWVSSDYDTPSAGLFATNGNSAACIEILTTSPSNAGIALTD